MENMLKQIYEKFVGEEKLQIMRGFKLVGEVKTMHKIKDFLKMSGELLSYHLNGNKKKPIGLIHLGLIEKSMTITGAINYFKITEKGLRILEYLDDPETEVPFKCPFCMFEEVCLEKEE